MDNFNRMFDKISLYCLWFAIFAVIGMMAVTCFDIICRSVSIAFLGASEIVSLLGGIAGSFALTYTFIKKGHIAMDVLVRNFPQTIQKKIQISNNLFLMILCAVIAFESIKHGMELKSIGEVSFTLQIPLFPFVFGISANFIILAIVILMDICLIFNRDAIK